MFFSYDSWGVCASLAFHHSFHHITTATHATGYGGKNTRTFVTSGTGEIDYASERRSVLEFVEDNDYQDRVPDTVRFDWLSGDNTVFPGWDQNNDFIPDFNQNDNFERINVSLGRKNDVYSSC